METVFKTDLSDPALAPYSRLTCAELRQSEGGLFIAESLNVISAALSAGYEIRSVLTEERHIPAVREGLGDTPVTVYTAPDTEIERLTGFRLHRGILAAFARKPLPDASEILFRSRRIAVLEGVTDPTNVGAIIRSAAALGMDAVLLASSCDPLHRRAARVSTGAVFRIPWTFFSGDAALLKSHGFTVCALALSDNSIPITSERLRNADKLALLLGSEGDGLSAEAVASADITVKIPMKNGVDSLNVAAAAAVAFWSLV